MLFNGFAVFVDGGFLRKRLSWFYRRAVKASDIVDYCKLIIRLEQFEHCELFRIYYYDAPPFALVKEHILTGDLIDFSKDKRTLSSQTLIDKLKRKKNFAVRLGNVRFHGWRLVDETKQKLTKRHRVSGFEGECTLLPEDFEPNIVQKGVDVKIGLDIASIAAKGVVQKIVIVSADTDMIPAMKVARKEGVRVYLDFFGNAHNELMEHSDEIINPISFDEVKARKQEDLHLKKSKSATSKNAQT